MEIISYAKQFEDVVLWNVFKDVDKGFYVDVGAADPEINSVTKLFYDKGWTGVNIEPSYQFFHKYLDLRSNDINLNIALGKNDSPKKDFYEIVDTDISTLDKKTADYYKNFHNKNVFSHKVISKTLAEVCIENNIDKIDFLKLNSNGSDLEIIESHDFNFIRPIVILVNSKNNTEQKSLIENLLNSYNYELALQSGGNLFYLAKEHSLLVSKFIDPICLLENIKITANHKSAENLAEIINQFENNINNLKFVSKQFIKIIYKKILNFIKAIKQNTKYIVIKLGLFVKRALRFFYIRIFKNIILKKKVSGAHSN